MNEKPRNVLRISDLTFILPDDFEGDLQEAFQLLLDHLINNECLSIVHEKRSTVATLLRANDEPKLCMKYGLFTMDENGNYILKE